MQDFHTPLPAPETPSPSQLPSVDEMFRRVAAEAPEQCALLFEGSRLSYAQLDAKVRDLAAQLSAYPSPVVGVSMPRGPEWVIAILAALTAGRAYVSLDVDAAPERQLAQLRACQSRIVLTAKGRPVDLADFGVQNTVLEVDHATPPATASSLHLPSTRTGLAAVIFTSGTSKGLPKGVQLTHGNLSGYFSDYRHGYECQPSDRVLWCTSVVWDANLFPVFGALTRGATLVVTPQPRGGVLEVGGLARLLAQTEVNYAVMPTAVFHVVASASPGAFCDCRMLWVGGEALAWSHTREVLQRARDLTVINIYGPTEATISCTTWSLSAADLGRPELNPPATATVPIGSRNGNVETLVFDADSGALISEIGGVGELVIAGGGISPGYLNDPEQTDRHFFELQREGRAPTWAHRSGDLVRILGRNEEGDHEYEFLGRLDSQVKYRGFRIDLAAIECLLEGHEAVARAVVRCVRTPGRDQQHLVAYVVPAPDASSSPAQLPAVLRDRVVAAMPHYMVPAAFMMLEQLPLGINGKVDPRALPPIKLSRELLAGDALPSYAAPETPDQDQLHALWLDILELDRVGVDDPFEAVGGDSLNAVRLVAEINRASFPPETPLHHLLTAADLYDHPTIRSLALRLAARREIARGTRQHELSLGRFVLTSSDAGLDLLAEAKLAADVRPSPARNHGPSLAPQRGILLTGATGFLGAHLLVDLAARYPDLELFVFVRAPTPEQARQRVQATLERFELGAKVEQSFARTTFVCGSFEQPQLGLDAATLHRLREDVDLVVHNGAKVNYCQPFSMLREANVGGTETLLRLCCEGRPKGMLYVSSGSVSGPRGLLDDRISTVYEDDHESLLESGRKHLRFSMGYLRSKWVAEQLVWEAGRRGLPVCVARPGFILGDLETGVGNPQDFIYRFVGDVVRMGSYPMMRRCREEFVAIDVVSTAIMRMIESPAALGHAYHLVPGIEDEFVTVEFGEQIADFFGVELRGLEYGDWIGELRAFIASCRRGEQHRSGRMGRSLSEGTARLEPVAGYLERAVAIDTLRDVPITSWQAWNHKMPTFDTANTDALLRGTGSSLAPPRDIALANLAYMRRRGIV